METDRGAELNEAVVIGSAEWNGASKMARKKCSIDYDDSWLIENFTKFSRTDYMADEYNRVHGTAISKDSIRSHCYNKLGLQRKKRHAELFSEEEDSFLKAEY